MHRLTPLLAPQSIVIAGASPRPGSVQRNTIEVIKHNGFPGTLHAVNPKYDEVAGLTCVPSIKSLPAPPDLAVLVVGAPRMEAVLEDAIAGGARALLIFDSCYLETDTTPKLLDRLKENARACGIPICGGNAMGVLQLRAKDIRQPLSPSRQTVRSHRIHCTLRIGV